MVQRDYILRLIEQMGEVVRRLRDRVLRREISGPALHQELSGLLQGQGMDLDFVRSADADTLFLMVAPTGEVDATRCWILAESLYLDGVSAHLEGDTSTATASLEKARRLYSAVVPGAAFYGFPEAEERVRDIDARLSDEPARLVTDGPGGGESPEPSTDRGGA